MFYFSGTWDFLVTLKRLILSEKFMLIDTNADVNRYRDKRRRVVLDKVSAYGACLIHASNMNDEPETQLHLIGVGGYFFNKKILAMRVLRALLVLCQWWRV